MFVCVCARVHVLACLYSRCRNIILLSFSRPQCSVVLVFAAILNVAGDQGGGVRRPRASV